VRGRPSLLPECYFHMLLVGYFEGIDSERGLEWRCADTLLLHAFLQLGERERVPDHSWLSLPAGAWRWNSATRCSPGCWGVWPITG
jgi:hypothetical protein